MFLIFSLNVFFHKLVFHDKKHGIGLYTEFRNPYNLKINHNQVRKVSTCATIQKWSSGARNKWISREVMKITPFHTIGSGQKDPKIFTDSQNFLLCKSGTSHNHLGPFPLVFSPYCNIDPPLIPYGSLVFLILI